MDFTFNIALGKVKYYAELPAANDALIVVPLENSGLEADATLRDYDDLAALLAGASNEQTTIGRKTVTASVTVTVDDTNNRVDLDIPDQVWTTPSGNQIGALLVCYDPDTTAGTDSTLVPLTKHDWVMTPEGDSITATITNFCRASG